jgi:hypothetical protein
MTEIRISLEETLKNLTNSIESTEQAIEDARIGILLKQKKIQQYRSDGILMNARIREHRKIILSYLTNIYSE